MTTGQNVRLKGYFGTFKVEQCTGDHGSALIKDADGRKVWVSMADLKPVGVECVETGCPASVWS